MVDIALTEPTSFISGDTVRWRRRFTDYPPSDSWVLTYQFTSPGGKFSVVASDNGDGTHLSEISAVASAALVVGVYAWQANVSKAGERFTVDYGSICVEPDFAAIGPTDTRSWAQQVLEAIEATTSGRATTAQVSYSVGGVQISKMSMEELINAREKMLSIVAREKQAERIARGMRTFGIVRVRA